MLEVGFFQNKKIAALAWRRQLGFIYVLMEAKQQDREGVFASKPVLRVAAGVFRDGVDDWVVGGLLHDSTALCPKCRVAFPDLEDGAVVVHDWSEYQVSRTTSWRIDKALGETTVKQPGNVGETGVEHPSRARVTRFPVPSSETPTTEGGPGETHGMDGDELAVFAYIARHGAAIRPESGLGRRLLGLIARRSPSVVMAKAIALSSTGRLSDRQWVFGLEAALEEVPDPKAAQRTQDEAKRAEKRDRGIWARRIEAYRAGGPWDPAWGEPPGAAA